MARKLIGIILQAIMLGCCLALLVMPGFKTSTDGDSLISENERRKPAPKPPWPKTLNEALAYPAKLEAYLNDHHGYREKAIRYNSKARLALGESSSSRVVIGQNGFMYYNGQREFLDLERGLPLDPVVRKNHAEVWAKWARWIEGRGIRFWIAPIPSKGLIYPQWLPSSVHRLRGKDRNEEFFEVLQNDAQIAVLNIRPGLRETAAKDKNLLYFKTDSHYNNYGGYRAYQQIMKLLTPQLPKLEGTMVTKVRPEKGLARKTDLSTLLYLSEQFEEFDLQALVINSAQITVDKSEKIGGHTYLFCNNPSRDGGPRLLIFHDSFGWDLRRFFCQSFPEVVMVHHDFKGPIKQAIEMVKPDLVIYEIAEYGLLDPIPAP